MEIPQRAAVDASAGLWRAMPFLSTRVSQCDAILTAFITVCAAI